jgi:hypothetical protein
MNLTDGEIPKIGALFLALVGMVLLFGSVFVSSIQAVKADEGFRPVVNPHSDLIFRATGAVSCRDCHRIGNNGDLAPQPIDNNLVRSLREKAKGIHGPGRFADCLRCHAGGSLGAGKY